MFFRSSIANDARVPVVLLQTLRSLFQLMFARYCWFSLSPDTRGALSLWLKLACLDPVGFGIEHSALPPNLSKVSRSVTVRVRCERRNIGVEVGPLLSVGVGLIMSMVSPSGTEMGPPVGLKLIGLSTWSCTPFGSGEGLRGVGEEPGTSGEGDAGGDDVAGT